MTRLILYSKKDCHLCEIAKDKLLEIQKEFPFSLLEIDIENDIGAFEKYKYLIPVIEIDGKIIFNYKVNEAQLRKILKEKHQP